MQFKLTFVAMLLFSVQGSLATKCYTSGCNTSDEFEADSPRDCCLGNAVTFLYLDDLCMPCVVFGFIEERKAGAPQINTFHAMEGRSFSIYFSVVKGQSFVSSNAVMRFSFNTTQITASVDDYDLISTTVAIQSLPSPELLMYPEVRFDIASDNIALERKERFTIFAKSNQQLDVNQFVGGPVTVIIQDTNVVRLSFSESNYTATEGDRDSMLRVTVQSDDDGGQEIVLARELRLRITPLTFQQQEALGIPLPPDFPPKPVAASINYTTGRIDFDNTPRTITLPTGVLRSDTRVFIPIVDDAINEAVEGFAVVMELVDLSLAEFVDLKTRNVTLGKILDNDKLFIGFNESSYTFLEDNGIDKIPIMKLNGGTTEQTYSLQVSASNGTAVYGKDYSIGGRPLQVYTIQPYQQSILLPFEILEDKLAENIETFILSLESALPLFSTEGTISQTTVSILDGTSIVIGFIDELTTVPENIGSFTISVAVLKPAPLVTSADFILTMTYSAQGTADPSEYSPSGSNTLVFPPGSNLTHITVTIHDDSASEGTETITYTLLPLGLPFADLTLAPNVSTVIIRDSDPLVIGFFEVAYNVSEGNGSVSMSFGVLSGTLKISVNVSVTTMDGSAVSSLDYKYTPTAYTLSPSSPNQNFTIGIVDDDVLEDVESFSVKLTLITSGLVLDISPSVAVFNIMDNDNVRIGFPRANYFVSEAAGTQRLSVRVLDGQLGRSVTVRFSTANGTAIDLSDYISISKELTFTPEKNSNRVSVPIIDDGIPEFNEQFFGVLSTSDPDVLIRPHRATVNILPNAIVNLTTENAVEVVSNLTSVVAEATSEDDQTPENLQIIANVMKNIDDLLDEGLVVEDQLGMDTVDILDSISKWPSDVVQEQSPEIVHVFEKIMNSLVGEENFTNFESFQENIIVNGYGDIQEMTGILPPALSTGNNGSSITLPGEVLQDGDTSGVLFVYYTTPVLFPLARNTSATQNSQATLLVLSPVIAATVVGADQTSKQFQLDPGDPILISLPVFDVPTHTNDNESNWSEISCESLKDTCQEVSCTCAEPTCVFWEFNELDGQGNWTSEGCTTIDDGSGVIQCNCTHLTNFAILVNIDARVDGSVKVNTTCSNRAIDIFSIIGSVLSMIGLLLTISVFLILKTNRRKQSTVAHVQLCVSIFLMFLVFLVGVDRTENKHVCVAMSYLIHYFTMASVMWMFAEAVYMVKSFLIVFGNITTKFIVSLSLCAWIVPVLFPTAALIASVVVGNTSYTVSTDPVLQECGYCFISHALVFFGTFLVPILVIISFNCVIFALISYVFFKHSKKGYLRNRKKSILFLAIVRIFGVMVLFGLTWILGAFTIKGASLLFQWLFVICNTLQGVFIFFLFVVVNRNVQNELMSCVRGQQEKLTLYPHSSKSYSVDSTITTKASKSDVAPVVLTGARRVVESTVSAKAIEVSMEMEAMSDDKL